MPAGFGHLVQQHALGLEIAAGGTDSSIVISTTDYNRMNAFLRAYYTNGTSAVTGITVTQKYGMQTPGNAGTPMFAENTDSVPSIIPNTANVGVGLTDSHLSEWDIGTPNLPEFVGLIITNLDAAEPVFIDLWTDAG